MTGNFGFSYIGLVYLLLLFIPNLIWLKKRPDGYRELAKKENKVLAWFERIGQALTTVSALIFKDLNPAPFSAWTGWLMASACLVLLYEVCWIRYFVKPDLKSFYGRFFLVPVPLASLPVAAFILLGVYGKVIWLSVSAVVLGIGHIGIHIGHARRIGSIAK